MTNDITVELFDRNADNEHSYPYLIHPLVSVQKPEQTS
jgi:hypothetical protein